MACGSAQTMDQLLVARFLQGLGGGGLGAVAMATVADIVPARQLGRWLGYQGVIFAVASAVGPIVGGLFVEHLSWRWAFFVNLPIGLVAATIVAIRLRLPYRRIPHALDIAGAALLTSGLALFVLLATLGGHEIPWRSPRAIALIALVLLLGGLFVRRERRAAEPVLPLVLFRNAVVRASAGINFTSGLLLWCGIFFVPQFVQQVREISPTRSGLVLMPLMFGAAFGTLVTGRLVARSGRYRAWPITGGVLMTIAMVLLASLDPQLVAALRRPVVAAPRHRRGLQHAALAPRRPERREPAPPRHRTSTALLFRTLGNTVGIPIFGGVLNAGLAGRAVDPSTVADRAPAGVRPRRHRRGGVHRVRPPPARTTPPRAHRLRRARVRAGSRTAGGGGAHRAVGRVARERVLLQTGPATGRGARTGEDAMTALEAEDRYTIISADCHAGG